MTFPELLLPAGNLKKLKCALHFGADAVYMGGKALSLRAFADNFSPEEMEEGVRYAHILHKKAYVTANIVAKPTDLEYARDFFGFLQDIGADAVLISDLGLLDLCREVAPRLDIHISTQASVSNARAARLFEELGAKRIVLARELSIAEIAKICAEIPDMQFEVFAHGAMCISYSGRCLLSSFLTGRSGNRGECAQPCRWQYNISDIRQEDENVLSVEEDAEGTYFMNSKDLNMLPRLQELIAAGVASLKVEGRMKSEFYVAAVAKAYRSVLDSLKDGDIVPAKVMGRANELLDIISHRPYTQAFADGNNLQTVSNSCPKLDEKFSYIATVLKCENGEATLEMRNRFRRGDIVEILSPTSSDGKRFVIGDIYMQDGSITDDAKLVQYIYKIKCDLPLEEGDLLIKQK